MSTDDMELIDDMDDFEDSLEDEMETVVMTDENGNDVSFFIIDEVEYNGNSYLLLVEEEQADDEEADAVIFKQVASEGDEFVYEALNDEEFAAVAKLLSARLDDYEISF